MAKPKAAVVAALVALTIFGAPLAASAAPHHVALPSAGFHTEDGEDNNSNDGDTDKDDHHKSIPPVFVVPGEKHRHHDKYQVPSTPTPTATPAPGDDTTPGDNNDNNDTNTAGTAGTAGIDPASDSDFVVVTPDHKQVSDKMGGVNPVEARAVDVKSVRVSHKSPADEFIDAAYIGLGLLGVAALGLGVTAGARAIRLRRSGKSDYLYGEK
jgi:hypothetical protein